MSDPPRLSSFKRALLERYLSGDLPQPVGPTSQRRPAGDHQGAGLAEGIVRVQSGLRKRPFFFLHGQWKTGGFFCFQLARILGSDRPFYAVEPHDFDEGSAPPSIEAIAAAHLRSVRAVQPDGPYLLGGWCNGGLLAYEMARQLLAAGQEMELLVLIDPVYLRYPARLRFVHSMLTWIGRWLPFGRLSQLHAYLSLRHLYRWLDHLYRFLSDSGYRQSQALMRLEREDYPGRYDWTAMEYAPATRYPGRIALFWSMTQPFRAGWRQIEMSDRVQTEVLSCKHETCLNVYLDHLGERLARSIQARRE